jgi:EpsI family protein
MWVLKKLPPRVQRKIGRGRMEDPLETDEAIEPIKQTQPTQPIEPIKPTKPIKPFQEFFSPVFVLVVILLGLTLVLSYGIEFREKVPAKKALSTLPLSIGEWRGSRDQMEQQFIEALHFTDYTIVDYQNPRNQAVNFYTAYYESQRKGEATHSPETCLPGSGWLFREAGAKDVQMGPRDSMRVNRAFMEKAGYREITYYWFAQRGRVLTNLYAVKFYSFWDALTRHRTDGALVRLITPVYENEKLGDAEARLQGFMRLMVPVLKEYIPE